jgi:hypothetical protein
MKIAQAERARPASTAKRAHSFASRQNLVRQSHDARFWERRSTHHLAIFRANRLGRGQNRA